MCANSAKFQMMLWILRINTSLCLNIDGQKVKQSEHVKLHFDMHVKELVRK